MVARRAEHDTRYESQLNAFVAIPYSKITEAVLEREKVPITTVAGEIIVHGNESEKFAGLLNAEIRRPMSQGVLDAKEPESLTMIREILATMLAETGMRAIESVLHRSGRAAGRGRKSHVSRSDLRQILSELGYQP